MPQAVSRQPKAVGELPRDAVRSPFALDASGIVYYVPGITLRKQPHFGQIVSEERRIIDRCSESAKIDTIKTSASSVEQHGN
jgi:hypothetical protein